MPKRKLSPEGEVIAAYGAALVAAFQVLINCLEESDEPPPNWWTPVVGSQSQEVSDGRTCTSVVYGRL
jgi:hypothetical protein